MTEQNEISERKIKSHWDDDTSDEEEQPSVDEDCDISKIEEAAPSSTKTADSGSCTLTSHGRRRKRRGHIYNPHFKPKPEVVMDFDRRLDEMSHMSFGGNKEFINANTPYHKTVSITRRVKNGDITPKILDSMGPRQKMRGKQKMKDKGFGKKYFE